MARRANTDKRAAEHRARSDERRKDVGDHLKRLGGRTRDDVTGDLTRGSGSPLGHGTGSKKGRR
jgi:hypothetical protein